MPPVGFEPSFSEGERPQNFALDRAATGTGSFSVSRAVIHTDVHFPYSCGNYIISTSLQCISLRPILILYTMCISLSSGLNSGFSTKICLCFSLLHAPSISSSLNLCWWWRECRLIMCSFYLIKFWYNKVHYLKCPLELVQPWIQCWQCWMHDYLIWEFLQRLATSWHL